MAEFQHGGRHNLSHLVLDPGRSRLYVAGTNVLYQLDDALRVSHKVETGETRIYFITSLHLAELCSRDKVKRGANAVFGAPSPPPVFIVVCTARGLDCILFVLLGIDKSNSLGNVANTSL